LLVGRTLRTISLMDVRLEASWKQLLAEEFCRPSFEALATFVRTAYQTRTVYPPPAQLFRAFNLCPVDRVKVVILGQDPYHGPGQAHGLSFSVPAGVVLPPSLRNIAKELASDTGEKLASGDLTRWAEQGVLLLNAVLTVEAGQPASHQGKGWEVFTDGVIARLSASCEHVVFVLWGKYAQQKATLIDQARHLVIASAHPSPFSADRGFFGSRPFSRANAYLAQHGKTPIQWS
jgi:uracil-DNA glycosylase